MGCGIVIMAVTNVIYRDHILKTATQELKELLQIAVAIAVEDIVDDICLLEVEVPIVGIDHSYKRSFHVTKQLASDIIVAWRNI